MANIALDSFGAAFPQDGGVLPVRRSQALPDLASGVTTTNAARPPKAIAWVKMAPDVLKAMALAANHAGRSAGDVWAEAAREWLMRRALEADYDVLANQPPRTRASAALEEKKSRLWSTIDAAMSDLRESQPVIGA